ncbi:hypothetical protein GWK47_010849 [Chionoecetes opilio]|uniref:Uncharacterized protein n=1 Tax=Chionoecetes opilio TaxID=41210 RepID=A0A8J5CNU1_CHIOP|nr:hypothetical protein GWK47_010849 [Chionoecetes opilio]
MAELTLIVWGHASPRKPLGSSRTIHQAGGWPRNLFYKVLFAEQLGYDEEMFERGKPQLFPGWVLTPLWIHLHLLQAPQKICSSEGHMKFKKTIQRLLGVLQKLEKTPKWYRPGGFPFALFGSRLSDKRSGIGAKLHATEKPDSLAPGKPMFPGYSPKTTLLI